MERKEKQKSDKGAGQALGWSVLATLVGAVSGQLFWVCMSLKLSGAWQASELRLETVKLATNQCPHNR
jgi:hypothetical protein